MWEEFVVSEDCQGGQGLVSCAIQFESAGETSDTIEQCGNKAMALLFGGKATEDLAKLRHEVSKKKFLLQNGSHLLRQRQNSTR